MTAPPVTPARPVGVDSLSDEMLLRRAVAIARSPDYRKGQWHSRRVAVMDVFALGYTYAGQLCLRFNFNPDEMVKR